MELNDAGRMVERWWVEIPNKYPGVETGQYIVMPNHFHGIVINVGADLRVCPSPGRRTVQGAHTGAPYQISCVGSKP